MCLGEVTTPSVASGPQWAPWAQQELGGLDLQDARLTERAVRILTWFMGAPEGSIPRATTNWAEAKAAYRYFDNEAVKPEAIYEQHRQGVIRRAQQESVVLAIGDTTQLSFSNHPNTRGLGPLEDESQNGLFMQPTLAVTPQRIPLGLVGQYIWVRDIENFRQSESKEAKDRPISEKESVKWLESFEASERFQKDLAGSPTKVVAVFDREGDVFEVFQRAKRPGTVSGLLVRSTYDRRVDGDEKKRLWKLMAEQPVSGMLTVAVPRKLGIKQREADLEIRFKEVALLAPTYRKLEDRTPVSVFCLYAIEADPPEGVEPLRWMLFTTEEVASFQKACEIIQWYTCRWMVELFFKTLKSGCQAEKRQLETAERLKRCLVFDCIVAWRILYLTAKGRDVPNLPCTVIFEEHEWKGAWAFVHRTPAVPPEPPPLQEMVRLVGRLGGHLGRKRDKEPGEMTLWRGLQRLPDLGGMWLLFTGNTVPDEPTLDETDE